MDVSPAIFGSILALLLGACVGAQREMRQQQQRKKDIAGFRTFSLTSVFGFLIGFLGKLFDVSEYVFLIIFGFLLLCILAYYVLNYQFTKDVSNSRLPQTSSVVTVVSLVLVFIIGILVAHNFYYFSSILTLIITSLLFFGDYLHRFAKKITKNEIFASLKFALISVVILPLLPDYSYSLAEMGYFTQILLSLGIEMDLLSKIDIFNPYSIWLLVVFISSIAYVGYILMRLLGAKKGILFTGFLGGLMSSTALTTSFAAESKKAPSLSTPFAIGIIIACSTMFFRILFEVLVVNPLLFPMLFLVLGVMGGVGYAVALYFFHKGNIDHIKPVKFASPFSLKPAFEFTLFFVIIALLSELFVIFFGDNGIYLLAFFSGFADVDPQTLTLSALAKQGEITNMVAVTGITLAAFSNTLVKAGIALYLGSRNMRTKIITAFGLILLVGILLLLL